MTRRPRNPRAAERTRRELLRKLGQVPRVWRTKRGAMFASCLPY